MQGGPKISHLFFADDLLLFGEASCTQAKVMHRILIEFCEESGQKVNIGKSKIWFSQKKIAFAMAQTITNNFGMCKTGDLGRYLGVPLFHGRIGSHKFDYLVDKVRSRLGGWQRSLLSQAAQLLLVQTITATIPTYVMNSCKLPKKTMEDLEKANRRFVWGDSE